MTRKQRKATLLAAHAAIARGERELARELFALCRIDYIFTDPVVLN